VKNIDVLFIAGFGPIIRDFEAGKKFYKMCSGCAGGDDYLNTNRVDGVKEFSLWPLSEAAESCFDAKEWPSDIPVPQAWLEFDVATSKWQPKSSRRRGIGCLSPQERNPGVKP